MLTLSILEHVLHVDSYSLQFLTLLLVYTQSPRKYERNLLSPGLYVPIRIVHLELRRDAQHCAAFEANQGPFHRVLEVPLGLVRGVTGLHLYVV